MKPAFSLSHTHAQNAGILRRSCTNVQTFWHWRAHTYTCAASSIICSELPSPLVALPVPRLVLLFPSFTLFPPPSLTTLMLIHLIFFPSISRPPCSLGRWCASDAVKGMETGKTKVSLFIYCVKWGMSRRAVGDACTYASTLNLDLRRFFSATQKKSRLWIQMKAFNIRARCPPPHSAEAFVAPCCRRTLQTGLNETHFHLRVIKDLISFHAESRGGCSSSRLSLCGLKRSPVFFFTFVLVWFLHRPYKSEKTRAKETFPTNYKTNF